MKKKRIERKGRGEMKIDAKFRKNLENSVVRIKVESIEMNWTLPYQIGKINAGYGSGFFISKDLIVTCSHVIDMAKNIFVEIPVQGTELIEVEVVGICPKFDIGLLRTKGYTSKYYLKMGDSNRCEMGDEVIVVGYPKNYSSSKNNVNHLKFTTGIISGQQYGLIQTDSAINSGNSGGPMILNKQVIGINSRKAIGEDTDLIGYAVPIHQFKVIYKDLLKKKKNGIVYRPSLAFEYTNTTPTLSQYVTENSVKDGILVNYVYPMSPLGKIGIKEGDMITKFDGYKIDSFGYVDYTWFHTKQDIYTILYHYSVGDKVSIEYYHKNKKYHKTFVLEEYIPPIRVMYPIYEEISYVIFGGMVMMNMSMNHIEASPERMMQYMTPEGLTEPKVLLTFIYPNTPMYLMNNFESMDVIKKINKKEVKTLKDVEEELKKPMEYKKKKYIYLENQYEVVMMLDLEEMIIEDILLSQVYKFPITGMHVEWIEKLNLKKKIELRLLKNK
jgi:S1-C subfamily serine protease